MPSILLFKNHISPEVNGVSPDKARKMVLLPASLALDCTPMIGQDRLVDIYGFNINDQFYVGNQQRKLEKGDKIVLLTLATGGGSLRGVTGNNPSFCTMAIQSQ